ncbi:hypothetical protein N6H18_05900 [Reichenbachiella agarivorans]|uniref:Uncharacterized protein n=1 Tax=Reichenbachiella agarivorans TaxID=2979464 RepID=A0ABY6CT17_9BACT|nr:hypothetical protein [Reichenbachiella agarivorans]UXP33484.1 hypothetical protein N6H18_05900 [Reichenbachiella agarivorans]
MKKLKPIFYALYITYFLVCVFVAVTHDYLVLYWKWDFIDTWVGLMRLVLRLGGIGTLLFASALIIERLHINELKKKIAQLEKDLTRTKSKSN